MKRVIYFCSLGSMKHVIYFCSLGSVKRVIYFCGLGSVKRVIYFCSLGSVKCVIWPKSCRHLCQAGKGHSEPQVPPRCLRGVGALLAALFLVGDGREKNTQ